MKLHFPDVVAAVKAGESSSWDLGDALIKHCGPPSFAKDQPKNKSWVGVKEVVKELKTLGYDETYPAKRLKKIRGVAFKFSGNHRYSELSYSAHEEAGKPEVLNAVMQEWRRQKQTGMPSKRHVRRIRKALHVDAHIKKGGNVNDKNWRRNNKNTDVLPDVIENLPSIIIQSDLISAAQKMAAYAETLDLKLTEEMLGKATQNTAVAMRDSMLTATNILGKITTRINKRLGHRKAVMEVVERGAA